MGNEWNKDSFPALFRASDPARQPDLPLQKGSVINDALNDASLKLRARLNGAVRVYLSTLDEACRLEMQQGASPEIEGLDKTRVELLARIGRVDMKQTAARAEFARALGAYDEGRAELSAWVTVAGAADRFRL